MNAAEKSKISPAAGETMNVCGSGLVSVAFGVQTALTWYLSASSFRSNVAVSDAELKLRATPDAEFRATPDAEFRATPDAAPGGRTIVTGERAQPGRESGLIDRRATSIAMPAAAFTT